MHEAALKQLGMEAYDEGFRTMRCGAIALALIAGYGELASALRACEGDRLPVNARDEAMIDEIVQRAVDILTP